MEEKKEVVLKYVRELAKKSDDPKSGKTDSLLIAYKNKLLLNPISDGGAEIIHITRCRSLSHTQRMPWDELSRWDT